MKTIILAGVAFAALTGSAAAQTTEAMANASSPPILDVDKNCAPLVHAFHACRNGEQAAYDALKTEWSMVNPQTSSPVSVSFVAIKLLRRLHAR